MAAGHGEADLNKFLSQVDQIQSLIQNLNSEDDDQREKAQAIADKLIETQEKKLKRKEHDNTGINKSVINQRAFDSYDADPTGAPDIPPDMDQKAFMEVLEKDAKDRYERRKEQEQEALKIKDLGNELFKLGKYEEALVFYNQALQTFKDNTVLWTNRAQTYIKLEQYENAINDCDWALRVFENCLKAHVHRGKALLALKRYDEATESYEKAIQCEPSKRKAIEGYINEVERVRTADADEKSAREFLEGGDSTAKGLVDILERLNKEDQLPYFYSGGLNILRGLLTDSKERALFRSHGGMSFPVMHHCISKCFAASPRSLSREEIDMCQATVACLAAACKDNEENQRVLLDDPSLPSHLLRFLQSQRNACKGIRHIILTLLHDFSQFPAARSLLVTKFDVSTLLESTFGIVTSHSNLASVATGLLNNLALDKKFQASMREDIEKHLLPSFEKLMVADGSHLPVLPSCVCTVMNLCNDAQIRKKVQGRKETWGACKSAIEFHIPKISEETHREVVNSTLGLINNMTFDLKDSTYLNSSFCSLICEVILRSPDDLQERALQCLGLILPLIEDSVEVVIRKGLIPKFIGNISNSGKEELHKPSIKCLTVCTQRSEEARARVIDAKGLSPLVALLKSEDEVVHGNAALCLSHLVGLPKVAGKLVKTNIIQHLLVLTRDGKQLTMRHNCSILIGKLATQDQRHLERLRELHGIEILHDVMKHIKE